MSYDDEMIPAAPSIDFATFVKAVIGSRYQWVRLNDSIDMAVSSAHWIEEWTPLRFTADGKPVNVHGSLARMRHLVADLGVLEDEGDQNPFPLLEKSLEGTVQGVVERWGRANDATRQSVGVWLCASLDALTAAVGERP